MDIVNIVDTTTLMLRKLIVEGRGAPRIAGGEGK